MIRVLLLTLALASAAAAQSGDPAFIAQRASGMLEAAAGDLQAAESARDRVAALTKTIRAYEEGLTALRTGMRQAAIRERTLRLAFDAKRDRVARLLGVLSTLERAPSPLLLMHPTGPAGTARSGMMLADVTPGLQAEVAVLRAELEDIQLMVTLQESAAEDLREGLIGAQTARAALSKAIADRTDLPQRFTQDPEVLRQLLETADTLTAFAAGLGTLDNLDDIPAFEPQRGTLPLPGPGVLLRQFGEEDAAGVRRPGMLVAMEPGTLVTTPTTATLRYAGPLLDYGNVIVLDPGDGYLMVLAGLDQVYGGPGQILTAGSPVGLMTAPQAPDGAAQQGSSGQRTETLYIEVRQGDVPVDPAEWFTVTKDG